MAKWKLVLLLMLGLGICGYHLRNYLRPPEPVAVVVAPPVEPPPVVSEAPSPPRVAVEVPEVPPVQVAELPEFENRVTFRRQKQMAWEEAIANLPLFRLDAVRTHEKANAKITFTNGSVVNMVEESLLIINPGAFKEGANTDRLLMRKGKLKAETKKELWILTTAALFRIKPQRPDVPARGTLAVEEGKNLKVVLQSGTGMVLKTTSPGKFDDAKAIKLTQNKPLVIAAPTVSSDFGMEEKEVGWIEQEAVDVKDRELASVPPPAAPSTPKIPLTDFVITSPPDYSEVSEPFVELKGKVKGKEASISVNGKPVSLNDKMEFRSKVRLAKGANAILIQLNRNDGSPIFRRWTVIRKE